MDSSLSSDLPWEDILSLHICPRLKVGDLYALSQTCKAFRLIVEERLPASTWKAAADNSLSVGHSLRSLPEQDVKEYLQRVARAKQILPEPSVLGEHGFLSSGHVHGYP